MQFYRVIRSLVLTLGYGLSLNALSAAESPEVQLRKTIEGVIEVLYQPATTFSLEEKREQILNVMNQSFSFDIIVRRTLGRNWDRLDANQQRQIISLAADLMIHSYTKEFSMGPKPTVEFKKPVELSKNKLEIASVFSLPGTSVNLSYRLARMESGWQVYDVIVEGVSMVSNYRKQFDAHFQKKDGDALITQLEEKLAAL